MKTIFVVFLIGIVIFLLNYKINETFQSETDYIAVIGNNTINMKNNNTYILDVDSINWIDDKTNVNLGSNVYIDLIYNSGKSSSMYSSGIIHKNDLKQLILNKTSSKSFFIKIFNSIGNILYSKEITPETDWNYIYSNYAYPVYVDGYYNYPYYPRTYWSYNRFPSYPSYPRHHDHNQLSSIKHYRNLPHKH